MTALFGNVGGDSSSSKNLVEFRAGKMHLSGTTVTADKRKGLVYVYQSDDSLMHFCWKDRTSGVVEDDLIIFPEDVEYKRVPQCTTGRAYVLKFKLSSRKFFFWMQEPKTDKDSDNCKKVNEYLNHPPLPGSGGGSSSGGGLSSLPPGLASLGDQLGDSGLQSLLSSMDQNQLLHILGMPGLAGSLDDSGSRSSSRPATSQSTTENKESESSTAQTPRTPPTGAESQKTETPTPASKNNDPPGAPSRPATRQVVQLSDLQNILSTMQVPGATSEPQQAVDLARSFNTEALAPILSDPEVQSRLSQYLPEVKDLTQSKDEVQATIQSPQFKQALSTFSAALQSGQLAPLVQQFGLGQDAVEASSRGDILGFVRALQKAEEKSSKGGDDDEEMAVD